MVKTKEERAAYDKKRRANMTEEQKEKIREKQSAYRKKRRANMTDEQKEQIYQWIQKHDSMTVEKIAQYIEEEFQVIYKSKQSYYDLLELGGMSYHKTFPVNPKKDEAQVLEKREEIKKNFWHKTKR